MCGKTSNLKLSLKQRIFLKNIVMNDFNVSKACVMTKIDRSTYYTWLKANSLFAQKVEEIKESEIDFVESKLMERISGVSITKDGERCYSIPPDVAAMKLYLFAHAKERGYADKKEAEANAPAEIQITRVIVHREYNPDAAANQAAF